VAPRTPAVQAKFDPRSEPGVRSAPAPSDARSRRSVATIVAAASSARPAQAIHATVNRPSSARTPVRSGPTIAPTNRPVIITPTAQAGASGLRCTTARLRPPGQAQPRAPATSAAATITPGSPAVSIRYPATLAASIAATGRSGSCPARSAKRPSTILLIVAARLTAASSRPATPSLIPLSTA
jgi:hypothetical protein